MVLVIHLYREKWHNLGHYYETVATRKQLTVVAAQVFVGMCFVVSLATGLTTVSFDIDCKFPKLAHLLSYSVWFSINLTSLVMSS